MTIRTAQFPFQAAAYNAKMLDNDIDSLKGVYQARGFLDAKITPHFNYYYQDLPQHLFALSKSRRASRRWWGRLISRG